MSPEVLVSGRIRAPLDVIFKVAIAMASRIDQSKTLSSRITFRSYLTQSFLARWPPSDTGRPKWMP